MQITVYDNRFNANEWFIWITLIVGFAAVFLCPKRFPVKESILYMLYSIFVSQFFDNTISLRPFDFYDVNDTSAFEFMDFVSYIMFAPFGYFFVYLYEQLRDKRRMVPLYIAAWSVTAIGFEYSAYKLGVYHYKNGYNLYYSFPIYLFVQSVLLWLAHRVRMTTRKPSSRPAGTVQKYK